MEERSQEAAVLPRCTWLCGALGLTRPNSREDPFDVSQKMLDRHSYIIYKKKWLLILNHSSLLRHNFAFRLAFRYVISRRFARRASLGALARMETTAFGSR